MQQISLASISSSAYVMHFKHYRVAHEGPALNVIKKLIVL